MMISAHQVSHQLHALGAPVGVRNVLVCGSPGVHHLILHWPISLPFLANLLELFLLRSCGSGIRTEQLACRHDRPGDAGQLIGERDGNEPRGPTQQELSGPIGE